MRGSWRLNKDCNILTSTARPSIAVCRYRLPGLLNRRPGGPASLGHVLIPASSHQLFWSPNSIGGPEGPFCWVVAFSTTPCLQLLWLQLTGFLSSPSYIIVQSPTQSLEWHVWSSSSGNNCHAVHRSLSSGASVYECTMGFYLVPFFQPSLPTRFLLITLIGMSHFLPVHHFGMAYLAGLKVNIQHCPCGGIKYNEEQHVAVITIKFCYPYVGVSPIDGLVLMWRIPTELSSAQTQSRTQSRFCLSEPLPGAVIFLIVKLMRVFSLLSFVYILFAFNIFLITYFCVVSSFEPPLDHNTILISLILSYESPRFCCHVYNSTLLCRVR